MEEVEVGVAVGRIDAISIFSTTSCCFCMRSCIVPSYVPTNIIIVIVTVAVDTSCNVIVPVLVTITILFPPPPSFLYACCFFVFVHNDP